MDKMLSIPNIVRSNSFAPVPEPSSAFMNWSSVAPQYDPGCLPLNASRIQPETRKPYSFMDIMDSGSPVTSVFLGLMQRRKRRESRPRRQRTTFTSEQTLKLEIEYNRTEYISRPRRYEVAKLLNLSENQIKIWFQNRRAKEKRIEKAHIDQQIRNSSLSNTKETQSNNVYSLYNPYMWSYTAAAFNRILTDEQHKV
ncbi:unnamed protein product [Mytilus coruscus]|uniref:Homeobox domain-containing protein n=1 Tax=Mytilus coruscus TaxID=42192 RepID=A0A6J8CGL6_MYTCO|nr:unnamed protein product [Mytilus coruscus]